MGRLKDQLVALKREYEEKKESDIAAAALKLFEEHGPEMLKKAGAGKHTIRIPKPEYNPNAAQFPQEIAWALKLILERESFGSSICNTNYYVEVEVVW